MRKLFMSLAAITFAYSFSPSIAMTILEKQKLTQVSIATGWMQATCYYYTMNKLSEAIARDTIKEMRKNMAEKMMEEFYDETKILVVKQQPKCEALF